MSYKYTDKELKKLLESLVVLVDTREQQNRHIVSGIEKQGFQWRSRALESGDYSCVLPASPELGIVRDIFFDRLVLVERKNSIEELSGTLAQGRQRFENEMLRAWTAEKHLIVEDGSWEQIINGEYLTAFKPQSFYRSLLSFGNKYSLRIHFVQRALAAKHILNILGIYVKNYLENQF